MAFTCSSMAFAATVVNLHLETVLGETIRNGSSNQISIQHPAVADDIDRSANPLENAATAMIGPINSIDGVGAR